MHGRQAVVNQTWSAEGLDAFGLGIGLSTGDVAAALLGSDERLEYTLVGDTVNLSQRLQELARPAGTTVVSGATVSALSPGTPEGALPFETMESQLVKGRETPVEAFRLAPGVGFEISDALIGANLDKGSGE
jgi:class 3 adenylate cyclase